MKKGGRGRRGMTLLELLIVILIIGILVGLLIPATQKMRAQTQATKTKAIRRTLTNAILAYHAEYGLWPVDEQVSTTKTLSRNVIAKLRPPGNDRAKLFWEGEDSIWYNAGKKLEYYVIINPQGRYPIGEVNDLSTTYAVSFSEK